VRVKISYGVDIEEAPEEIEELFDFVYRKKLNVDKQLDLVERLLEERDLQAAIVTMDKLRLTLAKIDNRIADVSNIAQGYVSYIQNEGANDATEGRSSVDTPRDDLVGENTEQSSGGTHSEET